MFVYLWIHFFVAHPHLSPVSPLLLYPANRTFSITCTLPCRSTVDLEQFIWLVNGQRLTHDEHRFSLETLAFNSQRLTIVLTTTTTTNTWSQMNYTCRYKQKESSIVVRRRTSTRHVLTDKWFYMKLCSSLNIVISDTLEYNQSESNINVREYFT
jgi:hypothetical protein